MMPPRRKLRLAILLGILAALAGFVALRDRYAPFPVYAYDFDNSMRENWPAVSDIFAKDHELYNYVVHDTFVAYRRGGWPAATARFNALKFSYLQAYADDRTTLACDIAWTAVIRALTPTPNACRDFLLGRYDDPNVAANIKTANAACNAALISGEQRRHQPIAPQLATDAEYTALTERTLSTPNPVTAAERAAAASPDGDARLMCQAALKTGENAQALPPDQEARLSRARYSAAIGARQRPALVVPAMAEGIDTPAPDGLRCAPAGTVFTLSMESSTDGRPITWTSLGQHGWDCRMRSSVSGERDLIGSGNRNPLRLLWPLTPGRSVGPVETVEPDGTQARTIYRITGEARTWLPWGRVNAVALDEEVSEGGTIAYIVTHYWSPDLGWKIGQRSRAVHGSLPNYLAPDWQVIAEATPP
jgi:hypothetical protein